MKRLAFVILVVFIMGCIKEKETIIQPVTPQDSTKVDTVEIDTTFTVENLSELTLGSYHDSVDQLISFKYIKGDLEKLTLTVEGLPEGLSAEFEQNWGIPNFETKLKLKSDYIEEGVYSAKLKVVSLPGTGLTTYYDFTIRVKNLKPICHLLLADPGNKYLLEDKSINDTKEVNIRINWDGASLFFDNLILENSQDLLSKNGISKEHIVFKVDCIDNTITIPEVQVSTNSVELPHINVKYKLKGSGTFDTKNRVLTIDYTVFNDQKSFDYTITGFLKF